MTKFRAILSCVLCFLAGLCATSPADVVILRDGTRIEGSVRTKGDTFEVTTSEGRTVAVKQAEVRRVERGSGAERKDFEVTDELRLRVKRHHQLKTLATRMRRGGAGAAEATKELIAAGPDALPFLAEALRDDEPETQETALRALGELRGRSAAELIAGRLPMLPAALQVVALGDLADMGAAHTIPQISALYRARATSLRARKASIRSLGRLRDPISLGDLVAALDTAGTASVAAQALIEFDSPAALAYLDALIKRGTVGGRTGVRIIEKVAGPEHVALLLRLRSRGAPRGRQAADAALERLKASKAARVATYIALLKVGSQAEKDAATRRLKSVTKRDEPDAKGWATWWVKQNRSRARIAVVALGPVDPAAVRLMRRAVEKATGVQTSVTAPVPLQASARVPGSNHYRADALLDAVQRRFARTPHVVAAIAVTAVRVERPGQGPAIGGFRYGSCGLVSLPGLEAGRDAALRRSRLQRHALHVLARALRIYKSLDEDCPAQPVYEAAGLDRFKDKFSDATAAHVQASLNVSASLLAGDVDGALASLRALRAVADDRAWAVEIATLTERKLNLAGARRWWQLVARTSATEAEREMLEARVALIVDLTKREKRRR